MEDRELIAIIKRLSYKPGWTIELFADSASAVYLRRYVQLNVDGRSDATMDPTSPDPFVRTPWKSGKRYLSPHMCRQEIVGAVFSLIKDAEEHEMREWFRYKGAAIYNAHLDPEVLVEVARKKSSFNVRENAMTMEEPKAETPGWFAGPDRDAKVW